MHAEKFSGPIPPPQMLEQYNKLVPGFAERFMVMAEKQSAHRQSLESIVVTGRARSERLGLHYALILAILFGAGSFYLIHEGHAAEGIALIIVEIVGLAGAFIVGRILQSRENKDKVEAALTTRAQ